MILQGGGILKRPKWPRIPQYYLTRLILKPGPQRSLTQSILQLKLETSPSKMLQKIIQPTRMYQDKETYKAPDRIYKKNPCQSLYENRRRTARQTASSSKTW
jgi:hypothetical protein